MKNPAPKYLQNYLLTQELNQQSTRSSKKNYWQLYLYEDYHLAMCSFFIALTSGIN